MTPYFEDAKAGIVIYHGDCRELLPQLGSVSHVITDPPYSEYVHSRSRRGGSSAPPLDGAGRKPPASFNRVKEFGFESLDPATLELCAKEFCRLCQRWCLAFSDVESSSMWRDALTDYGMDYVRTGAWVKLGATPQFTGDRPAAGFEAITICHPKGKKRWNGGGRHGLWSYPIVLNRGGKNPRLHTTQKPLKLMAALISDFTNQGDTILDAFMGSGTTLRAAKDLGRKAIGIEREEQYCETAALRLSQEVLITC